MVAIIEVSDLLIFAPDIDPDKAEAMIEDALALAARVAPCLSDFDFAFPDAAKAIIRRAILRWNESDGGGLTTTQELAGPFSHMKVYDNRSTKGRLFWPAEILELQGLCSAGGSGKAFSIDTAPPGSGVGADRGYWTDPTTWVPEP